MFLKGLDIKTVVDIRTEVIVWINLTFELT